MTQVGIFALLKILEQFLFSYCKSVLISTAEGKGSLDFTISSILVYFWRKWSFGLLFLSWFKFEFTFSHKQECIPVGCIPLAC